MNMLIEFLPPDTPITSNDRDGSPGAVRDYRRRKSAWQESAYYATIKAFGDAGLLGPKGRAMPPCEVYLSIPVVTNVRRDPHNWFPTVKAVVDGITRAGVWPDDNATWVRTNEPSLRVVERTEYPRELVYVRLVPRKESDADSTAV